MKKPTISGVCPAVKGPIRGKGKATRGAARSGRLIALAFAWSVITVAGSLSAQEGHGMKCPVMGAAQRHTAAGAMGIGDWWLVIGKRDTQF